MFCILILKGILLTSCCFCLATVVFMPFVAFLSRLGMAHFSVSRDSIASVFIFVRIGFEPCNLVAFVLPGPAICFSCKMLCLLS